MPSDTRTSLFDRTLAEALRALERDGREPIPDDAAATCAGREVSGSLEAKVIARATAADAAPELMRSIRRFHASAAWLAAIFMIVVAVLGAGAARASLGVGMESRVNFFLALGTLLGVQTVVLLVWLLLMFVQPSAMRSYSLGGFVRWVVDGIMRRASRSKMQLAALEGTTTVQSHPRIARWTLSTLSHGAWLSFNVGCLVALLALLSARYYTFVWETTILSERAYAPMVEAIGAGPRALGFNVPSEAQIASSQWTGVETDEHDNRATSQAWSGLLVGSIVVYGALPRLVLLIFCAWRMRSARRRYRLDLNRTGFALLAARLSPREKALGVVDHDDGLPSGPHERSAVPTARPTGPPAIVGIEMDQPGVWPPRVHGVSLHDLGILNDRPDRQRAIHQLHTSAEEPAALVMVCSLTSTPDRGLGSILAQLRSAVSRSAIVLLTGGHALRERVDGAALARRIEDWRALATQAGIRHANVLELDLDHATHASLARLSELLREATGERSSRAQAHDATSERNIERAFSIIVEHVEKWGTSPDHREQTALHREILKLYGSEPSKWTTLISFASVGTMSKDAAAALRSNADRAVRLLPPNLRVRPKWAIAGASAGALGCIAAAMIAAPAAIGALPIWTAIGSAIAAAASTQLPVKESKEATEGSTSDAVRAAMLSTLLLELQGRSETVITQVLERVLAHPEVDDPGALDEVGRMRDWLATVRHRFDLAIAEDTAS